MIIPRERKLVRMYVQVTPGQAEVYRANDQDPEVIMQAVRNIMQPYQFDASRLEWSTIYSVSEELRIMIIHWIADQILNLRLVTDIAENCLDTTESFLLVMLFTPTHLKLVKE